MTRAAIARCTGDAEHFLSHYWGRAPLLHSGGAFEDLLSLDHVDQLISQSGLRTPAFRMVQDGTPLPQHCYTRSGRIGSRPLDDLLHPGRVYALFDHGATIVLQGLHRYWEPLNRFCRELERELEYHVQANAYITPPGSSGLHVHSDPHDVFALQTFGTKHWYVYKAGDAEGNTDPVIDHNMCPGDALYLPRGTPHAPRTADATSVHVTIGIRPTTWRSALEDLVKGILSDERFDEALPPGYATDPAGARPRAAEMLSLLRSRLEEAEPGAIMATAADRFIEARPPLLAGQLRQLVGLDELNDETFLRARRSNDVGFRRGPGFVELVLGDRTVQLPAETEPAIRCLLEGAPVGALHPWLDKEGRRVLARRLVREGVLVNPDE